MSFDGNPACLIYATLKIIEQEKVFNDPETLKPYPIMTQHIKHHAEKCPRIETHYDLVFKNNEAKRAEFLSKPRVQAFIKKYYSDFITPTGAPPPIPQYIPATPEELSSLNKILKGRSRSRKLRRKNRKTRRQRN